MFVGGHSRMLTDETVAVPYKVNTTKRNIIVDFITKLNVDMSREILIRPPTHAWWPPLTDCHTHCLVLPGC